MSTEQGVFLGMSNMQRKICWSADLTFEPDPLSLSAVKLTDPGLAFGKKMPLVGMLKMDISDSGQKRVANSSVRTCAPGSAALSWPGCPSLLALMSSLCRFAAELLKNFPGWCCRYCPPAQSCTQKSLF